MHFLTRMHPTAVSRRIACGGGALADLDQLQVHELRELAQFASQMTDADGAVVGRALRIPGLDEAARADGEAIVAVGVADVGALRRERSLLRPPAA